MKKQLFCISLFILSFSLFTPCAAQTKSKTKNTHTISKDSTFVMPAAYKGPSGCPNAMAADEFKTVQKTVSAETDMDEVLNVAKKVAVTHCFLADQVKTLMKYLRSDENRFEFFKVVYPHIYDQKNYINIGDTFKDVSYKDKIRIYVNSLE